MFKLTLETRSHQMNVNLEKLICNASGDAQLLASLVMPGMKGKCYCVFDWEDSVLVTSIVNKSNEKDFQVLHNDGTMLGNFDSLLPFLNEVRRLVVKELGFTVTCGQLACFSDISRIFQDDSPKTF